MSKIHERIKELRIKRGMSQQELANKTGYQDRSSIAKVQAGKVDLNQSKIYTFAKALDTTVAYLMDGGSEQQADLELVLLSEFRKRPKTLKELAINMIRQLPQGGIK